MDSCCLCSLQNWRLLSQIVFIFSNRGSWREAVPELAVLVKSISEQTPEVNSEESSGPDGLHSIFLEELKCEILSSQECCVT